MRKDFTFCVVGRGSIGTRHIKNLKALSCGNIISFSESSDAQKDEEYKAKYAVETFHDIDEVRRRKPEVFIIAAPTSKHIEYALIAAGMKSHIFMEKPVSHSLDGIDKLKKEVSDKQLVFFTANNFRFHPVFIKFKELIDGDRFGRILFARIQAGQYLPDWHPWEDYRQGYSARRDLGGGVVLTLQHEIDYAYWLFGAFKHIKSYVKKIGDIEADVEDIASIIIETEKGSLIEIHLDYLQRPAKRTIQIQGTKGSVDYRMGDRYLKFYHFENQSEEAVLDINGYDNNEMYMEEMKYFINCISGEKNTISGLMDGIYVLNACLEIKQGFKI